MKKRRLVLVLSMAMCVTLLAGCGDKAGSEATGNPASSEQDAGKAAAESTGEASTEEAGESKAEVKPETPADPLKSIEGSIYYFAYPVDGMDDMVQYFHFYGDDLGIGAVFYAAYAWNQITFSGTYQVEEAGYDYTVELDRDGNQETGTAPYTITFYDWDGSQIDTAGYDGTYFYNTTAKLNADPATGGGNYRMNLADDEALAKYAKSFGGELGIAYQSFVSPEDASSTLVLNTNGTYEDLVVMAVDGTWAQSAEGQYTLTPDSESDQGATISRQEDGSYLYVSADGTEMTMQVNAEAAVEHAFVGTFDLAGMEAALTVNAYDDGTCTAAAGMGGVEMEIDQGTWSADEAFTFTFQFDAAGEIVSEYGGDTGVQITYEQTGVEAIGGGDIKAVCGVVVE